ncbi:outer membrane protein transport protein [bacterium]|nr:outer membrane protein transport protein [bacterium]
MRFFVLILCLFLFVISAFSAGMNLPCVGAKALSMGGAFRAIADDGSAVFWNPAGLSANDASQVNLLGQLLLTFSTYVADDTLIAINQLFREGTNEKIDKTFFLGNGYFTYAPKKLERWRFGLGIYSPAGVGSTWDVLKENGSGGVGKINPSEMNSMFPDSDYIMSTTESLPYKDFRGTLGCYSINPGTSYNLTNKVSLGISAIWTFAVLDIGIPSSDYDKMQTDTGVVFQEGEFSGESYGFNLGVLYKPNKRLSFGGNLKYQTDFSFEGDLTETVYKFYNEDLHNLGLFIGDTILSGGKLIKPPVRAYAELSRPFELGVGSAYKLGEKLTISLDLSYTYWSSVDSIILKSREGEQLVTMAMHWVDTYRISVGGEYQFSALSARLGAFYEPNPSVLDFQNLFIPEMNDRVAFTGGLGLHLKDFLLEFSAETEFFGEIIASPNFEGDFPVNIPGTYTGKVGDLILSATYIF